MESVVKLNQIQPFYQNKKVLLTGHTGFKGSWLLLWLQQLGAQVKGMSLAPAEDAPLFHQIGGSQMGISAIGDIRNFEWVQQEIIAFQPDIIFHLAAQPLVRFGYDQPVYTYETNVMGTIHVLEAARSLKGACQIVLITTDKVYENLEMNYAYVEADKLGGYDPYSASKAACEIAISSYRNSFFNPADFSIHQKAVASARAGNVIGGGDRSKDRIIPDIVRALEQSASILVRNPAAIRPWQHVLEPLAGYLQLGAALQLDPVKYATAYNFGPEVTDALPVEEVVKQAIQCWGSGNYETPPLKGQPHEAGLLQLNSAKAKQDLGWQPKYNSAQAIAQTIDWYRFAAKNPREYSLQQIQAYCK